MSPRARLVLFLESKRHYFIETTYPGPFRTSALPVTIILSAVFSQACLAQCSPPLAG